MHPATRNGIVSLRSGESVEIFCSGSFVAPFVGTQTLMAQCVGNHRFVVSGRNFAFSELACNAQVAHTARRATRQSCKFGATEIEVGFRVSATRFLNVMDVCFDETRENTFYVHYEQTPANAGFQRSFPRPSFITGTFFGGRHVDRLYFGAVQRSTISNIIGQARVNALWDDSRDFFLARGHLAARADSIFGSQQRATFYFINAAPQWHSFNAGNWERIESGVRNMVANRNMNVEIYTGTFGIQELADVNGVRRQLFLDFDARGNGLIPVPTYFYKVVIGERFRRGVVFVGVNNPHATWAEINAGRYNICRDVSNEITYINWNRSNLAMGYSYACDVNEFVRVVRHLPDNLQSTGLLV